MSPATGPNPRRPGPPAGSPEVHAFDEQGDLPVELERLRDLAAFVLEEEGVRGQSELTLLFVEEAAIADLNERFMETAGPTDVLAFPIDDEIAEPGRAPDGSSSGPDRPGMELNEIPMLLGDVVICPKVAARNAAEHGKSVEDELALLVVHGALHVLGMDHAAPEEEAAMTARTEALLTQFAQR
jgi:probable rRNA maturation factor